MDACVSLSVGELHGRRSSVSSQIESTVCLLGIHLDFSRASIEGVAWGIRPDLSWRAVAGAVPPCLRRALGV